MTPERFRRINALTDAALELTASQRNVFLDQMCGDDPELRRRTEDMIAAQELGDDFLEAPALNLLAREIAADKQRELTGRRIGRYEVLSWLGSGGNGEVWLARDLELLRDIALKIFTPEFAGRSYHTLRFQQEARSSSSLNHPNIVTVYEIGSTDGLDFIAQELVHGETLRAQLVRGPLPPAQAAAIAGQVATALATAHAAGLVHRDIKPENIMIRPDGLVKVVDFGLARFVASSVGAGQTLSRPGTVIGTIKYMSPEQARGLEVDGRSDIFSLGTVFYELVTGVSPFAGATDADILAAVLTFDPRPPSSLVPSLPQEIDRIVQRSIAKEREKRYQHADEMRLDLNKVVRQYESVTKHPRRTILGVLGAAALSAAAYGIYRAGGSRQGAAAFNSMKIGLLAIGGEVSDAAVSADGRRVAYARVDGSGHSLWMKDLTSLADTRILAPEESDYAGITFSPDGNFLYYTRGASRGSRALYRLPLTGGTPARLPIEATGPVAISRDGMRLAFIRIDTQHAEASVMAANADGSRVQLVATRHRPQYLASQGLAWSPNGRLVMCFGGSATYYTPEAYGLLESSVQDGAVKPVSARTWAWTGSVIWSADGRKLILAAGEQMDGPLQVWLVSYPEGSVRRITNDLSNYSRLSLTTDSSSLVAVRKETSAELWVTRPDDASRATQITSGNMRDLNLVAWTRDGKIVLSALAGDYRNIWMMDADGRNLKQLTTGPYDKDEVAVTRDGRYIVYQARGRIWRTNADGSEPRQLTNGALDVHPCSSADSQWIVYASFRDWVPGIGGTPTLWKVPVGGGNPVQISKDSASMPQVSPDGQRIACTWYGDAALRSASPKLAVLPFAGGAPIQVLDQLSGSTSQFSWTADGKALDYCREINGVGNVWRHPLGGGVSSPVTKFETEQLFRIACSHDGRQFAIARGKVATDVVRITAFL